MHSSDSAPVSEPFPPCYAWHVGAFIKLIIQHTAGACGKQALTCFFWPGQARYASGLADLGYPWVSVENFTALVTDLSPLHTCAHDELCAHLGPAWQ